MAWSHTNRLFHKIIATATSFSLVFAPTLANAQQAAPSIVIDNRTNPSAPAPSLDRTANGVQQLNIATPNGAGLSHNMFTQYGVEQKGLILNNATKATQTQLGGYVYGNANLHGKAAHVILNEVTGTQASQMLGYTEVAGQKANVVIVNPNGITCNGCGFINTDRVSLATGHPEIDATGKLAALTVSDGLIAFEGKGGDFTAVPVLDILSRRVTLDAKVNAQTARLVAGRSRFDYETGTVHALKTDGSKTPEFAIDSSALGGMYAGQISMLVTEAGAGVRVNGTMAANAGDMTLTADGRLVLNGSMAASGALGVQAAGIENTGTLQAGADTRLVSSTDIQNKGAVSAGQGLTVSGASLTNNGSMTAVGRAGASFMVAGDTQNSGQIGAAQGPLSLQTSSLTTDARSTIASAGDMTVKVEKSIHNTGQISTATGALRLTAGSLANYGQGFIGAGGSLSVSVGEYQGEAGSALKAETALTLISTGTVQNSGLISTNEALTVTAASLVNSGTMYGATSTTVQADQAVTNIIGQIGSGSGLLSVTAADLDNGSGKIIAQSGAIGIVAGSIENRAGVIQAQGDVVLSAHTLDNRQAGSVQSLGGSLTLGDGADPMQSLLNQGGVLGGAQALSLNTDTYENDASSQLISTGALSMVMAGTLDNAGTLSGDKGFDLTVGGFRNEASGILAVKSGDATLRVTGSDMLVNAGALETLTSGSLLSVESGGDFNNTGRIIGSGAVSVTAQGAVSNTGQMSALGGDLSLHAASFDNTANFVSAGSLSAAVVHDLTNTGALYGVGSVALSAGGILKNAAVAGAQAGTTGSIDAKSGNILIAAQTVENSGGGAIVAASGALGLSAESVTNSASVLQGQTSVVLKADHLTNTDQAKILAQAGGINVQGLSASNAQSVINTGVLQGQTGLGIQAGALNNRNGSILSVAGPVELSLTGTLGNEAGIIQSASDMTVRAGSYASDGTSVVNAGDALDVVFNGDANIAGHIVASKALSLSAANLAIYGTSNEGDVSVVGSASGNVTLQAGALQNAGNLLADGADATLSVAVTGSMTSSGAILAKGGSVELKVGALGNSGIVEAADSVSVKAEQSLSNTGTLFAGTDLTAQSMGKFSNASGQIGGAAVALNSVGVFENTEGKVAAQTGDLTLGAASLQNASGILQAQSNVKLTVRGLDNHQGTILAQSGGLFLASDEAPGAIVNTGGVLQAGGTVSLAFSQLENTSGSLLALGQGMTLAGTSLSDINNTGGHIASNGGLTLTARQYEALDTASKLTATGDLSVNVSDVLHNGGQFVSGASLTVTAGATVNDNGAVLGTIDGPLALTLTGTDGLTNAGKIQSQGADRIVSITAASLTNTSTGSILSNGAQNLTLTGALENAGKLVSFSKPLSIQAGSLINSSQIEAGGDLTLKSTGTLTNTGLVYGLTGAVISAATVENAGGQAGVQSGVLSVTADQIDNGQAGRLVASAGQVDLTAQRIANDNGLIEAAGDVTLLISSLNNNAGKVISDHGALMLEQTADGAGTGEVINTSGALQAGTDLTVYATTVKNTSGTILTQAGNLTLMGAADGTGLHSVVDDTGTLQAAQDLTLTTDSLSGAPGLSAGRDLAFTTTQGQTAPMLFSAGRNAVVQLGGAYETQAGSGIIAGGDATVRASAITNAGALMAGGALSVHASGNILNTGLMEGTTGLTLAMDGNLENSQGAILSDIGNISIGGLRDVYAGAIENHSGEISANSVKSDITIHATSFTNDILGGAKNDPNSTVIYYNKTYDQAISGSLPVPSNLNGTNKYYYGQKVLKIDVPEGMLTSDGQPASGYFLAALYGGGSSSRIVVTGVGASLVVNGAPALLSSGHDLTIDLKKQLINNGSNIAAGHDISMSGSSLDNTGYSTRVDYEVTCYNGNSCRYYEAPTSSTIANPYFSGGWDIGGGGWPWPSHYWASGVYTAVNSTIVAGNNLNGTFNGNLNNTNITTHATTEQLVAASHYTGAVPNASTPSTSVAALTGGSLTLPTDGKQFAQSATQIGAKADLTPVVSGSGLLDNAKNVEATTSSGSKATALSLPSYGGVLPPSGHESGATAAQHLVLPGFENGRDTSTTQIIASVPAGKALYIPNPSPDAHYLIELNPAYTSLKSFNGSEYLLDHLGDKPQDYIFLGDSAFDQQYVQQQIVSATGQTFLGHSFTTAASQMQALADNAVRESNQLGLTLGQSLSSTQQAALTSDMIWYVNETVGNKTVLVPKLYLSSGSIALTDATISGKNVSLVAGAINNSGTVSAQQDLNLKSSYGDIGNTGLLSGNSVSLTAQNGSIVNSDTLNTYLVQGGIQQQLGSIGTIKATGSANLQAGNNITFNGGVLTAGGDLSILAGNNLTLGNTTLSQAAAITGRKLSQSGSAVQNYGTSITVGGNATLAALSGDLKTAGTSLTSNGSMILSSAKTLDLGSVTNSQSVSVSGSKKGFLTHSNFSNSQSSSTDIGTTLAAGKDLTAVSGSDMHIAGLVGGGGNVTLLSGGAFTESALHSTASESASHHVAGFHMSTQGASGTVGYGSRTDAQSVQSSTYTPSVVASTGGSLNIGANGPVKIDGSIVAAAKDLGISGSSVAFTTEQNSSTQSVMHKDKSIGVTGGISPDSMVGQAINGALGAKKSGTGVQSALSGLQTGLGEGLSVVGGALTNNIIGAQVSVGFSSNKSKSNETQTTVQGSTASAGGTLSIVARGDNAEDARNGDVRATAAHLSGHDVDIAAAKDITLQSGVNTEHTAATSSSKSASIGVEASVGVQNGDIHAGVSVTASASTSHQHSASDSTTNVDTTVSAADTVTLSTPGTTTLNGAEVNGERVSVKSGMLVISSPQDTASYNSDAESGGFSVSIPVYGAGSLGASANVSGQTVKDTYRSTESTQSGLYAGSGGLDVDVSGNTTLSAGVLSSTADVSLNHFHTGSLDTRDLANQSSWSGTSVSAGGGFGAAGGNGSGSGTLAVGHVDHDEQSVTRSVITGTVGVESGQTSGSYSTDLTAANGHLDNNFNATKVNNTLHTQVAAETAAQTAVELGVQAYNRWGPKSQKDANSSKQQPISASQGEPQQSDQPIQTGAQNGSPSSEEKNTQLNTVSAHGITSNRGGSTEEAAVRQGDSVTMVGQEPTETSTEQASSGSVFWQESSQSTVMTPEGQVEYISLIGHHRPSQPVAGAASTEAAVTWSAVGELGLVAGTAVPGPLGTAFSTVLAWRQWQSGDKTGAAVTAGLGLLNSVGVDASGARAVLSGLKEEQAAATVGLAAAKSEITGVSGGQLAQGEVHEAGLSSASLCFVAGTPVLTPAGYRQIEALRVGDKVISRDEVSGLTVVEPILQRFHHHNQRILSVLVAKQNKQEVLGATSGHPFYVIGRGWVEAGRLHHGDEIWNATGGALQVLAVAVRPKVSDTYNFEVKKTHSYFVGRLRAWVHNACAQDVPKENFSNGRSVEEFYGEINKLPPGERVAKVKEMAKDVAQSSGMVKDNKLSRINNRDVYVGKNGKLYALDTQHGTFEVINPKTGRHLGEVDFNFELNKNADLSGSHDLKVK
ncbi:hemagglutinin repeat-containing protein [Acetobacter orientalis]|uniref:two-partner secretion domain-containing protein n=1 Tax=Acetobacter orientalis TaxID=146474 RepID=UPI0039EC0A9A